jgi:hypothetical protein
MAYGLKVKDTSGNEMIITPEIISLFDGGREAMPTSGTNGQTYGETIDITPNGESAYNEADIGVLADSFIMNIDLTLYNITIDSSFYIQSWFLNNSSSFFTRNESTGVLTTFIPDKSAATAYDGLLSVYPIAFWDKRGASTFSDVNIFAGTSYLAYDQSASAYKTVYTVGSQGVENVDYVIFLKHYKGE